MIGSVLVFFYADQVLIEELYENGLRLIPRIVDGSLRQSA